MKFGEWFDIYFEINCKGVLTHDCCSEYSIINRKHFYSISEKELRDIKPIDVQTCLKTSSGYSSSRQRKVYYLLHRVIQEALINDYVDINVVDKVKAPRKVRKEVDCYTSSEVDLLMQYVDSDKNFRMVALELWTGLRRSELLALRWENINLEEKYIKVCQTLIRTDDGERIVKLTKSRRDRFVPLTDQAIEILELIRKNDSSSGYLFKYREDKPLSFGGYYSRYKHCISKLQQLGNFRYLSAHKLRHTFATFLLKSGVNAETARRILGHSDLSTTQIYVHSDFEQASKEIQKLNFSKK